MYYAQFELDKVIRERFFPDFRNGFFVECGAFDGLTECTCKFFEESMGWTGVNIEPTPYAFNRLVQNRPNGLNLNVALSSVTETKKFTNAIHPDLGSHFGNGSLAHTKQHKDELINMGCRFDTFDVQCVLFKDVYEQHKLPNIDLFVLDVEGHEVEALKGIMTIPVEALPKVFCIENTISGNDEIVGMLSGLYRHDSNHVNNGFFIKI